MNVANLVALTGSVSVTRIGNVLSGYITRCLVILFSALACRCNKRALISFMGCGIIWSIVELTIVLVGNRAGPMTLTGNLRYVGALIRGFSEGAAVAGCALVPGSAYTIAAAVIILFDAGTVYAGASEVSRRLVTNPRAYMCTIAISALWCAWRPHKGAYPAKAMWIMSAFGFAWNAVAMISGARVVYPANASIGFALYDALFEIGLLYAALSQIALVACSAWFSEEDEKEQPIPVEKAEVCVAGPLRDGSSSSSSSSSSSGRGCRSYSLEEKGGGEGYQVPSFNTQELRNFAESYHGLDSSSECEGKTPSTLST